jgi:sec-independent protein translocase protein TatB
MFGIGLPEMILIMALALIVVGPDKLPDLARSLAKGLMELKKTAEGLKDTLAEEGNPLDEIRPDLEEAAKSLKNNLLDVPPYKRDEKDPVSGGVNPPAENAAAAYQELIQRNENIIEDQTDEAILSELKTRDEPAAEPKENDTAAESQKRGDN